MSLLDGLVENSIYLLFPIFVYLLHVSYVRNLDREEKDIFLELALFSSLFLMIRFGKKSNYLYNMAIYNIPLLVAYIKRKDFAIFVLSISLIIYYFTFYKVPIYVLFIEYISYYINYIYIFKSKKVKLEKTSLINNFVVIKSFILTMDVFLIIDPVGFDFTNIITLFLVMTFFIIYSYLMLYLIKKYEEIVYLNNIVSELEKEKNLHKSMFKIAHEVKNPLAVCKGYIQMIDYNNIDKVKKYIPVINSEIDRCLIILNDFSDFGKIKIEKEEIDLVLLVEETCEMLDGIFHDNKIETDFRFLDDEIYMDIDYNRFKQVLVNMFKNSVEAKIPNKKLKISLRIKKYKKFVKVIIKDNGCGMCSETLSRVDEFFYTTKEKGTGLGVALSKEIVERHGGNINYESSPMKGCIVTITLPYFEKEKKS